MRRLRLVALAVLLSNVVTAQLGYLDKKFLKDTTHVILEDDPESAFNAVLKMALEKFWTITPYDFITESEFKSKYLGQPNRFFLGKVGVDAYSNSSSNDKFSFLRAFTFMQNGKKSEYKQVGEHPVEMYLQATSDHSIYKKQPRVQKLEQSDYYLIIGYIQNSIRPAFPNPPLHAKSGWDRDANGIIRSKTMLVAREDIKAYGVTEEMVLAQYGEGIKIVSKAELEKFIEARDATVVYFRTSKRSFLVNGEEKEKTEDPYGYVVDAGTGFVFYEMVVSQKQIKNGLYFKKLFKP